MKISLSSHCFSPSTGGIETVSELLAREFVERGHEVRVLTQTPGEGEFPFAVLRQPNPAELVACLRWSDVYLQNNISLRTLWPVPLIRRATLVIHQTWINRMDGRIGWQDRAKQFALRWMKSVAISKAVAEKLMVPSVVVGNPYDDAVFTITEPERRDRELIFVGRLVSDKGVDLLIAALARLRDAGLTARLTIVGDGPEWANLLALASDLGLQSQICFVGNLGSADVAQSLNRHRILVVPSRWAEPFGIVAVEGIACGCAVIGSADGGLAEAIGPCGVTFPNGDSGALAERLTQLLLQPELCDAFRAAAGAHLARFRKGRVAETYLELMKCALP